MPFKRLTCLASPEEGGHKGRRPLPEENMQIVPVDKEPEIPENEKGTCSIVLKKSEGVGMGLTVSGGSDKGGRPKISNMRSTGIAAMSDLLQTSDYIVSVNGIKTGKMRHGEIISLLKNVGQTVTLEIEYHLPPTNVQTPTISQRTIDIILTKEDAGFGFVVRGGHDEDKMKTRSLVVTHIRPGSAADKDGTVKTGDRLKCINSMHLYQATLEEVNEMLKNTPKSTTFTFEYDVSVMDAVNNASGPLLVEISKTPGCNLGLILTTSIRRKKRVICIEKILPASIADRCGALRIGDQLLSIDGVSLDINTISLEDASKMLLSNSDNVRIEILPIAQLSIEAPKNLNFNRFAPTITSAQSLSALNHFPRYPHSHRSLATSTLRGSTSTWHKRKMHRPKYSASAMSLASVDYLSGNQVVRSENLEICLLAADNNCPPGSLSAMYFGIQLQGGVFATEVFTSSPAIAFIESDSAAERCGRIQVGDRLLSVNGCGTENETLEEVKGMLSEAMEGGQVYVEIEFDVAESVVPSSGTFHVKLPKRREIDLGIVVGKMMTPNEPLVITDIKRGSTAHRTGTIQAGDKLLAIDGVRLDKNSTVEDALALLLSAEDVVRLKIRKDEENSDDAESTGAISFTVELKRYGGPLGITISGTEDAFDPIIISGLTPGGLAHRTGAIHEGDQILSINSIQLRTKPLSEAIRLLQTAGETVTLKIRKKAFNDQSTAPPPTHSSYTSTPRQSMTRSTLPRSSNIMKEPITELSDPEDDIATFQSEATYTTQEASVAPEPSYINSPPLLTKTEPETTECARIGPAGAASVDSAVGSLERSASDAQQRNSPTNSASQPKPHIQSKPLKRSDSVPRRIDSLRAKFESTQNYPTNTWNASSLEHRRVESARPSSTRNSAGSDWQSALRDLQSVGQSTDIVRDLEESIMTTRKLDISDDVFRQHSHSTANSVSNYPQSMYQPRSMNQLSYNVSTSPAVQLHKITLQKNLDSEDFGFSLSDGQLERGVYVHSTRSDGPADRAGMRPYDRLLQVNGVRTRDFDCCQAIPLIAQAGKRIVLVIARHPQNTGISVSSHPMPLLAPPVNVPSTSAMRSSAFETM
uniref:glutamate receptor-interacting protein 1-like n=1 Tax=Styela clava TaxID=7725 RepID=UPI00193AC458|nr:glutamate receptor-interacting protein 1-like [Styela clava]